MSYSLRNYRHRNPKTGDEQKTNSGPFFQTGKGAAVQRKKRFAFFQTKLSVNKPGDIHEKEADSVAGQVVNRQKGQKPVLQQKEIGTVQRLATSKEDEKLGTNDARMEKDKEEPMKPVQTKQAGGDKKKKKKPVMKKGHNMEKKKKKKTPGTGGMMQKKEKSQETGGATAGPTLETELEKQSGKGGPLPAKTLAEMNHSFGMDFSHVRIHHDGAAAALCNELNAQAFTHGCDIYFNEGKYNPESEEGKRLLAHELTHVAQQTS
jgi:hypothetical protein